MKLKLQMKFKLFLEASSHKGFQLKNFSHKKDLRVEAKSLKRKLSHPSIFMRSHYQVRTVK